MRGSASPALHTKLLLNELFTKATCAQIKLQEQEVGLSHIDGNLKHQYCGSGSRKQYIVSVFIG